LGYCYSFGGGDIFVAFCWEKRKKKNGCPVKKTVRGWVIGVASLLLSCAPSWAAECELAPAAGDVQQVMQYNFAIHILAMLLVGFGFLMVFVRRYGYGATT
jgi:ammonium transporter Rh